MQAATNLPVPMALPMMAGSLESYVQSVNRFPMLTAEQEQDYARRGQRGQGGVLGRQIVGLTLLDDLDPVLSGAQENIGIPQHGMLVGFDMSGTG